MDRISYQSLCKSYCEVHPIASKVQLGQLSQRLQKDGQLHHHFMALEHEDNQKNSKLHLSGAKFVCGINTVAKAVFFVHTQV